MLARDDDNRMSSTMGTWTTSRARGRCWPCWPSRTGSGPGPRAPWAPPALPRAPRAPRRPAAGGLLDGEAGGSYRVRPEALRQAAIPPPGQAPQDDEEPGDAV